MKKIVKGVLFLSLLLLLICTSKNILRIKLDEADTWKIYYEQPENSIDMLALGSSHVFGSVNPAILWEDYGIAGYDLCAAGSNTVVAYYYLQEALRTQQPKAVIVGLDFMTDQNMDMGAEIPYMWSGGMKNSRVKAELLDSIAPSHKLDILAEFPLSHTRVDELAKRDFLPYRGDKFHRGYKGSRVFWDTKTEEYDTADYPYSEKTGEIPERTREMLDKIIALSREKGFELILYASPALRETEVWESINAIEAMAEEEGILFINCYKENGEIGIDYENDFSDKQHVNYAGNRKTSEYIGRFLREHCLLEDHRGGTGYETWDLCSEDYNIAFEDFIFSETEDAAAFLEQAHKEYYTSILLLEGGKCENLSGGRQKLLELGMDPQHLITGGTFVLQNGEVRMLDKETEIIDLDKHTFQIDNEKKVVYYDRERMPMLGDGISMVVYDNRQDSILVWREYKVEGSEAVLYRNDVNLQEIWNKR